MDRTEPGVDGVDGRGIRARDGEVPERCKGSRGLEAMLPGYRGRSFPVSDAASSSSAASSFGDEGTARKRPSSCLMREGFRGAGRRDPSDVHRSLVGTIVVRVGGLPGSIRARFDIAVALTDEGLAVRYREKMDKREVNRESGDQNWSKDTM